MKKSLASIHLAAIYMLVILLGYYEYSQAQATIPFINPALLGSPSSPSRPAPPPAQSPVQQAFLGNPAQPDYLGKACIEGPRPENISEAECQRYRASKFGKSSCDETANEINKLIGEEFGKACGKMGVHISSCAAKLDECSRRYNDERRSNRRGNSAFTISLGRGAGVASSCPWIMGKTTPALKDEKKSLKDSLKETQDAIFESKKDELANEREVTEGLQQRYDKLKELEGNADRMNQTLQAKLQELRQGVGSKQRELIAALQKLRNEKVATEANEVNKRQRAYVGEKQRLESYCRTKGQEAVTAEVNARRERNSRGQNRTNPVNIWDDAAAKNYNLQRVGLEAYYACMDSDPEYKDRMIQSQIALENETEDLRLKAQSVGETIALIEAELKDLPQQANAQQQQILQTAAFEFQRAQQQMMSAQQDLYNYQNLAVQQRQQMQQRQMQLQAQFQNESMQLGMLESRLQAAGDATESDYEAYQDALGMRTNAVVRLDRFKEDCCLPGQKKLKAGNEVGESFCAGASYMRNLRSTSDR